MTGDDEEQRDIGKVLDIAYGRVDLEATQEIPELSSMPPGVYMVTRHYSYRCDGSVRADPPNHPLTWLPMPERSLRNLPPEWQSQSGSWESGKYRK